MRKRAPQLPRTISSPCNLKGTWHMRGIEVWAAFEKKPRTDDIRGGLTSFSMIPPVTNYHFV